MADEKKTVKKEDTSKAEKKTNPLKKVGNFFVKIGKAIAKFFKDLKGETKKIVWPGRQMVIKSTGIVLAAILVIGAGIWIIDFAVSGAVTGGMGCAYLLFQLFCWGVGIMLLLWLFSAMFG